MWQTGCLTAPRPFRLVHIRIDVEVSFERRSIAGVCAVTVAPLGSARWLELDASELEIRGVSHAGRACAFTCDGMTLRVDTAGVGAGEVTFDIAYEATPRRGLYFVGSDDRAPGRPAQLWSQGQDENNRAWFPCFDRPAAKATTEVIVRTAADLTAISNGVLVSDERAGDTRRQHWRFDHPHPCYLVALVVGKLGSLRTRWRDVDLVIWARPEVLVRAARVCARTDGMIELLSRWFGVDYPYESYAQIFATEFCYGAMENTTATILMEDYLLDDRAHLDHDVEWCIVHELAHQWFGNLVTARTWSEAWLHEAFASYAEHLWDEHAQGDDVAALRRGAWRERYLAADARHRRPVVYGGCERPIELFDRHIYDKGAWVLHMLRRQLGDDGFSRSLRRYLCERRDRTATTADLVRAIEDETGAQLDAFFDQWVLRGEGYPELAIRYRWDAEHSTARVEIRQLPGADRATPYRIAAQLRFRVGDTDLDRHIELTGAHHGFAFELLAEPTQVIFDPGKHLLAVTRFDKPAALWLDELCGARLASDRSDAAVELGRAGGHHAMAALVRALTGDGFWGTRAAAAGALAELGGEPARDALRAAVRTELEPRARRAIVRVLGELRGDARAADALLAVVRDGDPSYLVEAEACRSLGRTGVAGHVAALVEAAGRDSFLDAIRAGAHDGLGHAADIAAVDPVLRGGCEAGRPSHGRRAAARALGKLHAGRADRAARDCRARLEALLDDRDRLVREAAIDGLLALGDPAAVPALRRFLARDIEGHLRRRCRFAIRDLERAADPPPAELRHRVRRLEAELAALRELRGVPAASERAEGDPA